MRYALLLTGFIAYVALAQPPARVEGQIKSASGEPLQGDVTIIDDVQDVRMETIQTDAQGRFWFGATAGARRMLVAKADGYISEEKEWRFGQRAVEFSLLPAGSVSGRVVDGTGTAVSGARLTVRYAGRARTLRFGEEGVEIHTDELGYFSIPFVARGASFTIEVRKDDRLPATSPEIHFTGRLLQGVVVTAPRRGEVLSGKVMDSIGRPVAGATVRMRLLGREPNTASSDGDDLKVTTTDAEGMFQFGGLGEGRVVVVAGRPGGRPVKSDIDVVPGNMTSVHLVLQ